ncbi:MAG: hypothetical protein IJ087_10350 [Eggerthellaceae bacterium]|nr:hypothetical protein [Eggerthellaceae bacterium]
MALLGIGDYLCEACKYFDTDGSDGNHPSCDKQWKNGSEAHVAVRLGEECPFGYEFGVPFGYPVSMGRNMKRAYEIKAMMDRKA